MSVPKKYPFQLELPKLKYCSEEDISNYVDKTLDVIDKFFFKKMEEFYKMTDLEKTNYKRDYTDKYANIVKIMIAYIKQLLDIISKCKNKISCDKCFEHKGELSAYILDLRKKYSEVFELSLDEDEPSTSGIDLPTRPGQEGEEGEKEDDGGIRAFIPEIDLPTSRITGGTKKSYKKRRNKKRYSRSNKKRYSRRHKK